MTRAGAGPALVIAGGVLVLLGLLVWSGALGWSGRLPGDVRLERPGVRLYLPTTSMVLVSVLLSLVLAILRRLRQAVPGAAGPPVRPLTALAPPPAGAGPPARNRVSCGRSAGS